MRFSDTFIATYKGGQRYALWCRKRRIPSGAVCHRAYFLSAPVHIFSGCLVADELLASDRVLPFGEPLEMFLAHFSAQSPFLRKPSMPLSANLLRFGVVVLPRVAKLFCVIRLRLSCAQRFRDRQHCLLTFE